MIRSWAGLLICVAMLMGCGSSTPSSEPPPADPEVCNGHRVTDGCMNADNFAVCQEMSRRCPGQVMDLESCPLQFACP